MAISTVSVGQKIAAALINSIINIANRVDQVVVPTLVSGTGTSVSANGKVSMSATPALSVNGVFSSTYERYRIQLQGVGSASVTVTFVFRVAGVDVTTANYDYTELLGRNATASSSTSAAAASWVLNASTGSTLHDFEIRLSYPGTAQATVGRLVATSVQNPQVSGNNSAVAVRALSHRLSTAYDGFTITFTGGTFTGSVVVYGEHNN